MLETLWFIRAWFQWFGLVVLVIVSFRRGAAPERWLSSILLGMIGFDFAYHGIFGQPGIVIDRGNIGHFLNDLWVMAAIFVVAMRANRVYPLWLGAAQIIAVLAHCYRFAFTDIDMLAYAIMQRMPSWIQLVVMTIGLTAHIRRERAIGPYPSWEALARVVPPVLRAGSPLPTRI
ncbi:hypothetical protein [Novosphingobium sp. 9]|uniref:hypothetical protein n=1 Tax=Novosphingobium sp. 9 TaxID=2025349 RepID=UPI0021B4F4E9|nr:hypothetical protein [Novosphingobium sp. 9]